MDLKGPMSYKTRRRISVRRYIRTYIHPSVSYSPGLQPLGPCPVASAPKPSAPQALSPQASSAPSSQAFSPPSPNPQATLRIPLSPTDGWQFSPCLMGRHPFWAADGRGRCPIEQRGEFLSVRPCERANERTNERANVRPVPKKNDVL